MGVLAAPLANDTAGTPHPSGPGGYEELPELDRPRLRRAVAEGLRGPLTVLCSPPGFGKTVLLRQALAATGVGCVVHDDGPGAGDAATVDRLTAAVERWPSGPPVVVACRPGSPVGMWAQERDGAFLIDECSLSFRGGEIRRLLEQAAGGHPSDRYVDELSARTEGWPAAVRVVAPALRGRDDWDQAIGGIDGSEPRIAALFRHEVLQRQPQRVRTFLLRSSVLRHLDDEAARITGDPVDGAAVLDRMARERLFVSRLRSADGHCFAYFGLFRQALRRELRASDPAAERTVLTAAADWHMKRQEPERAAEYLIEAERWSELLDLIDRHGRSLYERGLLDRVAGWLDQVPSWSVEQRREIKLRRAVARTLLGQAFTAEVLARQLRMEQAGPGARALTEVLAARAMTSSRPEEAAHLTGRAIGVLRSGYAAVPNPLGLASRDRLLAMAQVDHGRSLWLLGDTAGGRAALREVVESGTCPRDPRSEARGALALLESWAGDHRTARRLAGQVMTSTRRPGSDRIPGATEAALALAHLHREEADITAAGSWLDAARRLGSGDSGTVEAVWAAETAMVNLAVGEADAGLAVVRRQRLDRLAPPPQRLEGALLAAEIRLHLLQGDIAGAEAALSGAGEPWSPLLNGAAVQSAVEGSDVVLAARRLASWSEIGSDCSISLERELWAAVVEVESGRRRQGYRRLGQVLERAEVSGHLRLLLDGSPTVHRLLRVLARSDPGSYATRVLCALGAGGRPAADHLGLSGRERQIIRYLPTSLSSAEMASRLYISVNTLKTHLRTIYRKLGAKGRRQAIARAQELGLA